MYFFNSAASAVRIVVACVKPICKACIALVWLLPLLQGCAIELAELPGSSFNTSGSSTTLAINPQPQGSGTTGIASNTANTPEALTAPVAHDSESARIAPLSSRTNNLLKRFGASQTSYEDAGQTAARQPQPHDSHVIHNVENKGAKRDKLYSIEAFNTPVDALLFALVSDAGLQLHLVGKPDAHASINAVDQPLDDILASLARQAGFAWQLEGRDLTVWTGDAYTHTYPINYLNIHRRTQSSVGLATQVGTINASNESGGSIANSSQTRIENISEHHFWDSLVVDIGNVINQGVSDDSDMEQRFSINREAGILTVHTRPAVHRSLQRYLKVLHGTTQRQVLIEATVVEVALSDNFDAGVDWQLLAKGISGISAAQVLVGAPFVAAESVDRLAGPAGLVSFVQQGGNNDVRATLSLLEQFGDVRILSRPRIIALNNQSSVLKVVDNRVYFTVNVQRRQTEERDEIVTETEIHTVPVGLVMNVTPQISERGMVMLNVRPTLSRILGFVNDPNPELALANVRNGVPEIQVREMESMLQVQSGNVAIIGGLMQETRSDNDARLPGLGALPGIGRLFKSESRNRRQTELLIVLRPTVLSSTRAAYQ